MRTGIGELRTRNTDIEWSHIKDFRNPVAHNYMGIDADEVRQIIQDDVPPLKARLRDLTSDDTGIPLPDGSDAPSGGASSSSRDCGHRNCILSFMRRAIWRRLQEILGSSCALYLERACSHPLFNCSDNALIKDSFTRSTRLTFSCGSLEWS